MSACDYLAKQILDHVLGGPDYTRPATVYLALHVATRLAAQANAGAGSISTDDPVPVDTAITLDPLGTGVETHTVSAVSGSGPYTLTLDGTLAATHPAATRVRFEPGADLAELKEPSGNGYARASVTNDATSFPGAATRTKSNGAEVVFADPSGDWGLVTHVAVLHAAAGGNGLFRRALATPKIIGATEAPVRFLADGLTLSVGDA